jgi:hypothetical protein
MGRNLRHLPHGQGLVAKRPLPALVPRTAARRTAARRTDAGSATR